MDKPKIVFDSSLIKEKEKKGMVVKKIRALKEFTLNTRVQIKDLVEGEVADVAFYDESQFKALLEFGNFIVAKSDESYGRDIPILLPIEEDVQLEGIPIEQQDENKPELNPSEVVIVEESKPTVEELNEILNKGEDIPITVLSNGEIRAGKLNVETIEAVVELEEGKGVTVESVEELFEEINQPEEDDKVNLSSIENEEDPPTSLGEQLEIEYNQEK